MGSSPFTPSFTQTSVLRILDANLDRAREGLRILEEWCRFGLDDRELTNDCKTWRQELARWHSPDIRSARDTIGDVGTELTHPAEARREDISHLLQANLCRVQEALRVLEEYGKLYQPEMGAAMKQLRYQVYTLDSLLMPRDRSHKLQQAKLYLVTSPHERLFEIVEAALQGGLTLVQYRDKDADDCDRLRNAQALRELCRRYGALFLVNDRIDLAVAVDADGVHLGQQDLPVDLARQLLGPQKIIGRSTHHPDDLQRAIAEKADYIGVGPVYETPTKAGRPAAGFEYTRYAHHHAPMPWFAIGGIDAHNLATVMQEGACDRVSVVRAIMAAENPTQVTQALISQLNQR